MDKDHRKGTLCGLLAAGLRLEGLLRVAIERPEAEADVSGEIRDAFELYRRIFEQAWPEIKPEQTIACATELEPDLSHDTPAVLPEESCAVECMEPETHSVAESSFSSESVVIEVQSDPAPAVLNEVRPLSDKLKVDELIARKESADLRRAFTLNDKFRFRRTLFGGSDAHFSEVLDRLESINCYEDAEEYMHSVVDPETDGFDDFLAIVKTHFGGRS